METEEPLKNGDTHHANGDDGHLKKDSDETDQVLTKEIGNQQVIDKEQIESKTIEKPVKNQNGDDGDLRKDETDETDRVPKKEVEYQQESEKEQIESKTIEKLVKNQNHTGKQSNQKLDKIHYQLETKKISSQDLDIEVTQWPDGEIRKLKIYESGNSVAIFYEEYDQLEDVDSPARDPGLSPEVPQQPSSPLRPSGKGRDSSGFFQQNEKKHKRLQRLQLEDDEGIVSKHATFFPAKIKRRDSKHEDVSSDSYYDMTSFPRGMLTLLNVRNFRNSSGMSAYPRNGTDRDADGLCALFLELGFIVERYDNPTRKIMTSALEIAAGEEKLSCCACAILTHGDEGILYATDQKIQIREITKLFRKRNLAGKPKLFIFQACQGSDYMESLDNIDAPLPPPTPLPLSEEEKNVTLPCEADFLYAYSTVPGYFSWRNSRQGSWFVQAICSVFREHGHNMDGYKMLTRVNAKISQRKSNTENEETDDKRQIASIVSQMRKDFYFFPPYGPLPLI